MMRRLLVLTGAVMALLAIPTTADAGGGCHRAGQSSGTGATVELSMNCMTPTMLHTDSHEITFVNRDAVVHNVMGNAWGRDELRPGDSFTHRFTDGTHLFSCTLHPGMIGGVVVGDGGLQPIAAASNPVRDADDGKLLVVGLALGAAAGVLGSIAVRRVIRTRAA